MEQRARVVAEARTWIGTPYHNCADVKGAGVDCAMLLIRVFVDCGLLAPIDPRPYPVDWHLHRDEERYLGFIAGRLVEVKRPLAGDIVVFRYGRCYSHGALVTIADPLTIIHAFHPARRVVEELVATNPALADPKRAQRYFSLWPEASA
jgi:cell wall-associated NlpC family hydrolase